MIELLNQKYYDVMEVSELLKMSDWTIRKYIKLQKIKAHKIGRSWYIKDTDMEDFILINKNIK